MENIKDILNNRLKKTKLNKEWFPFDHLGGKGEIRIISVNHVVRYHYGVDLQEIGYNVEVKFTSVPSDWRGRNMLRSSKYRNNEIRYIFRWGEGQCNAISMMKFIGADCRNNTIKTIKVKS